MSKNKCKAPSASELASGLIISVGEARKLLGKHAQNMSDDEIAMLILELHEIAPSLLKMSNSLFKQL